MTHSIQTSRLAAVTTTLVLSGLLNVTARELSVTAVNNTQLTRPGESIELSAQQLAPLNQNDLTLIHVTDSSGQPVLSQAVDTDFDAYRRPDIVVFQADFAPEESKTFTVSVGTKQLYKKEQFKAYGRFVRERFDDFAWENDRIAHRTYGKALETWEGEPLSSSTIDIWVKRTPRMVINEWYMADDYHTDYGEGADLYSAGLTRGCGGSGLWAEDRLWVSRTFVDSRVLANGPIRLVFELEYEPFDVNGISVSEVKRVTLDAGRQLNHIESRYKPYTRPGREVPLVSGAGLKKVGEEEVELNADRGWLAKWESAGRNAGMQGLGIVVNPKTFTQKVEDDLNHLMLIKAENNIASYWAGFCWDKAGHISDFAAWQKYLDEFAQGLASPIRVTVKTVD